MKIYLDQNKWIDLAKSIYKPNENTKYLEVSKKILEKSSKGEWIFPISLIHFLETQSRANEESRANLSKAISNVAKNYSIKPFTDTQKLEFINSFSNLLKSLYKVEINAIQKSLFPAIGAESPVVNFNLEVPLEIKNSITELVKNYSSDEQLFSHFMHLPHDIEAIKKIQEDDIASKREWEKIRIDLLKIPKNYRYRYFLADCFHGQLFSCIDNLSKIFNKQKKELIELVIAETPEETQRILESVPSLHVQISLMFEVLRNPQREIHIHDNRDIAFLATAIPYCDLIITEKTWKHAAEAQQLCSKYSTIIESDLNYLLSVE